MAYATRSPGRHFGDVRADGFHRARALAAERDGQVGLVQPDAEIDVDEVDAAGGDPHQRLFRAGLRVSATSTNSHLFGTAGLFHLNGFH